MDFVKHSCERYKFGLYLWCVRLEVETGSSLFLQDCYFLQSHHSEMIFSHFSIDQHKMSLMIEMLTHQIPAERSGSHVGPRYS
ncbi:unnamed protein product [Caretta caretta]